MVPSSLKTQQVSRIFNVLVRIFPLSFPNQKIITTLYNTVLLVVDRNVDLVSTILHGWTYQALVSDCLEMKLNRVVVAHPQKKVYDLDSKDFFWAGNAASPFPQVAEEIDAELNKYKQDAAEITRSTGVSDVNDISNLSAHISPLFLPSADIFLGISQRTQPTSKLLSHSYPS